MMHSPSLSATWSEFLPGDVSGRMLHRLQADLGLEAKWLHDDDEWVVGYRVLERGAASPQAAVLYLTRAPLGTGFVFELISTIPQDDEARWTGERAKVRAFIRDHSPNPKNIRLPNTSDLPARADDRSTFLGGRRPLLMSDLIRSGVHLGHVRRSWNPKARRFIAAEIGGTHIMDLRATVPLMQAAYEFAVKTTASGGGILFVGTKPAARELIAEEATRVGQAYVTQRWVGGLLTNNETIRTRLVRMDEIVAEMDGNMGPRTKKERVLLGNELRKLDRNYSGIKEMHSLPSAIFIVDAPREHLAVREAKRLNIPVIGILDSNCDPDDFDYPMPGNDDSRLSVGIFTRLIANAAREGAAARAEARAQIS
jgi:small subunit ribosomal protein S2